MSKIGSYCKAYPVSRFREFPAWSENVEMLRKKIKSVDGKEVEVERVISDGDQFYLQENLMVTEGIFLDRNIIFKDVTPEWERFCREQLNFNTSFYLSAVGQSAPDSAPKPCYDARLFPFTEALERNWRQVYEEFLAVRHDVDDWPERDLYKEGWKVFGLFDFNDGQPLKANARRCPFTTELIEREVPSHGAGGFSVLKPQTIIYPHEGYQGPWLRCHLPLQVPDGDCGLRVGGVAHRWEPGRVMVFDDRFTHEAWNRTDSERAILLFDFVPPAPSKK